MEIQKRILLSQYLLIIVGSINLLLVYGGSYIPSSHMYGLHYTHPDWFFLATLPSIIMIPLGITTLLIQRFNSESQRFYYVNLVILTLGVVIALYVLFGGILMSRSCPRC